MTPTDWIGVVGVTVTLIVTLCGAVAFVVMRIGRLEGKLDNGVTAAITRLEASVRRLFEKWDNLPCERHDATLSQLKRMLETTDKKEKNDA